MQHKETPRDERPWPERDANSQSQQWSRRILLLRLHGHRNRL